MCQSYQLTCQCGGNTAEIFFGQMLLDESTVAGVFCPQCSAGQVKGQPHQVWDNGWVLELDMTMVRTHAATFGMRPEAVTAEWVFDAGYVTWVGVTPDDTARRNRERDSIQRLAKTDVLAYVKALREWGIHREQQFTREGWRKMRRRPAACP